MPCFNLLQARRVLQMNLLVFELIDAFRLLSLTLEKSVPVKPSMYLRVHVFKFRKPLELHFE